MAGVASGGAFFSMAAGGGVALSLMAENRWRRRRRVR